MEAKITPKPIVNSDKVNKARDISGLRKWSRESRFIGAIMLILGWFTVPAEVFLRRKFGYRWFTPLNYYTGLFLFAVLSYVQYSLDKIHYWLAHMQAVWNPFYTADTQAYLWGGTDAMNYISWLYMMMGAYQLFKRWWRSRTNVELHSYDDGKSRLEFLGRWLKLFFNLGLEPLISIFFYISRAKKRAEDPPELIHDATAFTDTVIEPMLFFVLGEYCTYPIVKFWLYMTALAVAVYANLKETAKRSKKLDFKDSMIEAKAMAELKNTKLAPEKKPETTNKKEPVKPVPAIRRSYPDLQHIIEEMNRDRSHLAN